MESRPSPPAMMALDARFSIESLPSLPKIVEFEAKVLLRMVSLPLPLSIATFRPLFVMESASSVPLITTSALEFEINVVTDCSPMMLSASV